MIALWIVPYLLVSHLGPTMPMIFAERVLYLPSAGLCLLIGFGLSRVERWPRAQIATTGVLVVGCLLAAYRSQDRVGDWQNDARLFLHDERAAPRGVKLMANAAIVLHGKGRAFSAGFDLQAGVAAKRETEADWQAAIDADLELIMRFWHSPKTVPRLQEKLK